MTATLGWSDALWLARHRTPNDRLRFWGSALSSAVAAALVCTVVGLVSYPSANLMVTVRVVAESGTRGGVAFAVLLVTLPALHLTGQTWKLGSVERRQRVRQLRDAGAGPGELRRVVVADTVVPVAAGAAFGVMALGVGIALLNGGAESGPVPQDEAEGTGTTVFIGGMTGMAVVPNVVAETPWAPVLAVVAVAAVAALAAARSIRRLDESPRRRGSALGALAATLAGATTRPALLLALRRLADEPRATARPALLLGLAAVVAGASTWLSRQFRMSMGEQWTQDTFFPQSFVLVRLATWVGIGLCALGLLVVLADAVIRRRHADAAAVASGVPLAVLRRALVLQALLPAAPAVLVGLAIGGGVSVARTGNRAANRYAGPVGDAAVVPFPWLGWVAWGVALLVVATAAALIASTALRRTTRPDQLRVPA